MNWTVVVLALAAGFGLLYWRRQRSVEQELTFVPRGRLLSSAELAFLEVLGDAAGGDYVWLCKVHLGQLLEPRRGLPEGERRAAQQQLATACGDFVLCEGGSLMPRLVVELVRSGEGNAFLKLACQSAGLPLLRYGLKPHYEIGLIRAQIEAALRPGQAAATELAAQRVAPTLDAVASGRGTEGQRCPSCGSPMILAQRRAWLGRRSYWACSARPRCKTVLKAGTRTRQAPSL